MKNLVKNELEKYNNARTEHISCEREMGKKVKEILSENKGRVLFREAFDGTMCFGMMDNNGNLSEFKISYDEDPYASLFASYGYEFRDDLKDVYEFVTKLLNRK